MHFLGEDARVQQDMSIAGSGQLGPVAPIDHHDGCRSLKNRTTLRLRVLLRAEVAVSEGYFLVRQRGHSSKL